MTYPRSHLVDSDGGVYHVCSRCVRRAWLCGTDKLSGYNFDHRRRWLEDRILELAEIFAIDLYGYAVMSNHYHIVLKVDPSRVLQWSDGEIVDRWTALCPVRATHPNADQLSAARRTALMQDADRLVEIRERLTSLSWFMRFINEPLARRANKEDECKGRFWEGRFKSQRLLDENAILATMVYVDLNPVRAGIVKDAVDAQHTSLRRRLASSKVRTRLTTLNQSHEALPFDHSLDSYTELVRWTNEAQRTHHQVPDSQAPPQGKELWLHHYLPQPGHWQRANGSFQLLRGYANSIGQRWIKTRSMQLQH